MTIDDDWARERCADLGDEWEPADHQTPLPYSAIVDCFSNELSFERAMRSRGYRVMRSWEDQVGEPIEELASDRTLRFMRDIYGDEVLAAGFALLKRLRGDVWRTQEGVFLKPKEMTISHARNLVRWLERRARLILLAAQIEIMCAVGDHDGGEHAHDSLEQEERRLYAIENPVSLLRDYPLYRAIVERSQQVEPISVRRRSAFTRD